MIYVPAKFAAAAIIEAIDASICLRHKDCTQDLEIGGRAGIDDMTSERLRTIRTLVGNFSSTKGKDKR